MKSISKTKYRETIDCHKRMQLKGEWKIDEDFEALTNCRCKELCECEERKPIKENTEKYTNWKYCPWCGGKIKEEERYEGNNRTGSLFRSRRFDAHCINFNANLVCINI